MRTSATWNPVRGWARLILPLLAAALACSPPSESTPGSTEPSCSVPSVVGLNQAEASKQITELGLAPRRVQQVSEAEVGVVIGLDPPAGTVIEGCRGTVTIVVSSGSGMPAPPPVGQTAEPLTGTPSSEPGGGRYPEQHDSSVFRITYYEETFEERGSGFLPVWNVDTTDGTAAADNTGRLVTEGHVSASLLDMGWADYRVTFGGGDYDQVESFHIFVRAVDAGNFIDIACKCAEGALSCIGYSKLEGGTAQRLEGFGELTHLCATGQGPCDIAVEAIGPNYSVLANGQRVVSFTDRSFLEGGVGLVVDGNWNLDYVHVVEPGSGEMPPRTLFRDDFDVQAWEVEVTEDDYALLSKQIESGTYRWKIRANQGVTANQLRSLGGPPEPGGFPYRFDYSVTVRQVSASTGSSAGLLFRAQDYRNLYYFQVGDSGECSIYALVEEQWDKVAGPYQAEAYQAGGENVLRIVADGASFSFWVNSTFVFEATDERFETGTIGVAVGLPNAGDDGDFEFDDLRIGVALWGGQ